MKRSQKGLTLVELMVALVISLLLTLGAITIFKSNKQTSIVQEQMSRVQENGRMALNWILSDIRMAGFTGCSAYTTVIADPPPSNISNNEAIIGHKNVSGTWKSLGAPSGADTNNEAISLMMNTDCGAYLVGNLEANNANVQVNSDNFCNFQQNQAVTISDCETADVFRISSNPSTNGPKTTLAHANNVNTTNKLSKIYPDHSRIYVPTWKTYYINKTSSLDRFGVAIPTLYGGTNYGDFDDETFYPLVSGVTSLSFKYGVDTNNDLVVDIFVDAATVDDSASYDWINVLSVEVALTVRSEREVDGGSYLSKTFVASAVLRNRVP